MTSILLYIIEIIILCIVSTDSNANCCETCCEYRGTRFKIGTSIFPKGECLKLTCEPDGFYSMYGCPMLDNPRCNKYVIDCKLPYPLCCIVVKDCICDHPGDKGCAKPDPCAQPPPQVEEPEDCGSCIQDEEPEDCDSYETECCEPIIIHENSGCCGGKKSSGCCNKKPPVQRGCCNKNNNI